MWKFLPLSIVIFACYGMQANADPCRRNFGGCDRYNGLCWGTGNTTHFCSCKNGYKDGSWRRDSTLCVDVDECEEDPELCPENAKCENNPGSYTCTCRCGYVMDYTGQHCLDHTKIIGLCEVPSDCEHEIPVYRSFLPKVDFDTRYSENYLPDFKSNIILPYEVNDKSNCECETGFIMNSCGYCVDRDECYYNRPCTGFRTKCVNTEGSYYCECSAGYVLGPCRKRCYRQEQEIPAICDDRDLDDLKLQGISIRQYEQPITLNNWRTCASGVRTGDSTVERHDIDHDSEYDLKLTWTCTAGNDGPVSILKAVAEQEARWDRWSCWTECKATCWGGVQTRVRKCLSGLPGMDGCLGEGSQKRECYTGKKCAFKIRKDVETLSKREERDLIQAMKKYKADYSVKGFFNAAASHGWPNQCDRRSCCPHGAKMKFLAWHRTIMLNYEQGLCRYLKDKRLGIPYWNWLRNRRDPPKLVMDRFYDAQLNPFANVTVLIDRQGPMRTIQREDTIFMDALDNAHDIWSETTLKLIKPYSWHEFSDSLENSHGGPHVSICGGDGPSPKCRISLGRLQFAGFDPLFMFHHSQVDRLWAIAQKNMSDEGHTTWSVQTALEPMEDEGDFGRRHMPFANKTINGFPIVQAVNTMRDSYYYEELTGIRYDSLENNGFPTGPGVGARLLPRRNLIEALFVAHYLQSVEENVYINYYVLFTGDKPCNELDETVRVGGTLLQGTGNPYRNTVPRLIPLMAVLGPVNLDEDFDMKACYTSSLGCREKCPDAKSSRIASMPDPALVHYIPNQPIDVYKFMWQEGRKLPNWYINLDAQSQWIFFYGNRVDQIRQVRSSLEWITCNARRGRKINCSPKACVLPSGIYYLIDNSQTHCRNGLKLLVVSRK